MAYCEYFLYFPLETRLLAHVKSHVAYDYWAITNLCETGKRKQIFVPANIIKFPFFLFILHHISVYDLCFFCVFSNIAKFYHRDQEKKKKKNILN